MAGSSQPDLAQADVILGRKPVVGLGLMADDKTGQLAYARTYAGREFRVNAPRHVKLFKNGRNQAVRIPREFELPGQDAVMRKEGKALIIEPSTPNSLLAVLASLDPLTEDFPSMDDPPPDPVDI